MDAMSCLPPPQPASFLPAAYYTDAAIARALHCSVPDCYYSPPAASSSSSSAASAPSSSSFLADLPSSAGTASWFASAALTPAPPQTTGLVTCDSVLVASDAAPRPPSTPVAGAATSNKRRTGLGPAAAGRAGKRRARASKRAPTTYISTDPSNFRLMVQHVTGVQAEPAGADDDGSGGLLMPSSFDASLLGDCPTFGGAFGGDALRLPSDCDAAAALHHRLQQQEQQQQQTCFPTLDSWSVMYESSDLL